MTRRISRRTLLRGAGAAIGLPCLEAMGAPRGKPPVRLVFIYKPGGCVMPAWTPEETLAPLAPVKDDVLVLGGLDGRKGETGGNGHPLACAPWLSSAPLGRKDRGGYCTGLSVDQIAARKIGDQTRLPSLEVGCNAQRSAIHVSNVSWRGPGSPMGKEVKPRAVFTRLFGDPKGDKYRRSVIDAVQESARRLRPHLGARDLGKVDEYLESVRSIEKRIEFVERNDPPPPPKIDVPEAVPENYGEHVRLLSDLIVLGLQADSTRVVTFMLHNEDTIPAIPDIGVKERHHTLAHNDSRPGKPAKDKAGRDKVEGLKKADRWFVGHLARMLGKMKAVEEEGGSLLDHSLVLFGSGLSWGNLHWRTDLPILLAGRGGGTVKPGRRVRCPEGTPLANLFLSMLERVGARPGRLANSTGLLDCLD